MLQRSLRRQLTECGMPLCMNCGYDLRGCPRLACPECGEKMTLAATVSLGNMALTKQLLADGADVNAANPDGVTPLHLAAANGNMAIVQLLVDRGAEINAKTEECEIPQDIAQDRGHDEIVRWLRHRYQGMHSPKE